MSKLTKSLTLYDRDETGELIPKNVELQLNEQDATENPELVGTSIKITPLTRGEIKKMFSGEVEDESSDADADAELIISHCKDPQYTAEELKYAKPVVVRSIVQTILSESGIKVLSSGQRRIDKDMDEFGKN